MVRYVKSSDAIDISKFKKGAEYKLYRKSGEEAQRTFTVVDISHKQMLIKVKGGINGVHSFKVSNTGDAEIITLGMNDRNYLNPSSKDIIY